MDSVQIYYKNWIAASYEMGFFDKCLYSVRLDIFNIESGPPTHTQ